ncbi:MAG: hypothetical protein AABY26_04265 [Nanoarchaeota archaeon]
MIFSKGEVDRHLAKEELYFQRTKKQLSHLLGIIADIEKDLRQLRMFAETGLRNEKVHKILKEIEDWEEKIKTGLSLILQLAGEELTEKEKLPPIFVDILKFTVSRITPLEKDWSLTAGLKKEDPFRVNLKDDAHYLVMAINHLKQYLNIISHLFNSAEEIILNESKILFRQALGNRYLEEVLPKWVKILTKEFALSEIKLYFENEPAKEFHLSMNLPVEYPSHERFEIENILNKGLFLYLKCQRAIIILSNAGESYQSSIIVKYDSVYDAFVIRFDSYLYTFHLEKWFISVDTFFDQFISQKEFILTTNAHNLSSFSDDYPKIVSKLKNGVAP